SPTGPLHLGHAYAALVAAAAGERFLLRIEDIDQGRARPEYEAAIFNDLAWLGLAWPRPVMRQSARLPAYRAALKLLWGMGLLYPCTCNRRDIAAAIEAPQEGAALGPDGLIYPGTCRAQPSGALPEGVLRLNMAAAMAQAGPLSYVNNGAVLTVENLAETCGDVVLARRDMGTSYHLSVVVDDAAQGITLVTRGEDLTEATPIHVLLQALLGLPTPEYLHHGLIRDEAGKRLAKRDDARAIAKYRAEGASPADIRRMVGL
ncbi:MAG: tRNA glutamyl-Q(34) synthetase GluQRS, partial [Paracoccaceae bacterium]